MKPIKINKILLTKTITLPVFSPILTDHPKGWVSRFKKFLTFRREFLIQQPWITWGSKYLQEFIYIPSGFISNIYIPNGLISPGAFIHDFGYRYAGLILVDQATTCLYFQSYTKKDIDKAFDPSCKIKNWHTKWEKYRENESTLEHDFPNLFTESC